MRVVDEQVCTDRSQSPVSCVEKGVGGQVVLMRVTLEGGMVFSLRLGYIILPPFAQLWLQRDLSAGTDHTLGTSGTLQP